MSSELSNCHQLFVPSAHRRQDGAGTGWVSGCQRFFFSADLERCLRDCLGRIPHMENTFRWWFHIFLISYSHPYLGRWSNLTNIFQMGWNHHLPVALLCIESIFFGSGQDGTGGWCSLVHKSKCCEPVIGCVGKLTWGRIVVRSSFSNLFGLILESWEFKAHISRTDMVQRAQAGREILWKMGENQLQICLTWTEIEPTSWNWEDQIEYLNIRIFFGGFHIQQVVSQISSINSCGHQGCNDHLLPQTFVAQKMRCLDQKGDLHHVVC